MLSKKEITQIEGIIGYTFKNKELVKTAFCHTSYANEHNVTSNETLEFLGDGVLNLAVAEILYDKELDDEGRMSVLRSKIVSRTPLAREVERLDIMRFLKLGSGFDRASAMSVKFISNVYESVVAAIYKDGGLNEAKDFIRRTLINHLDLVVSRDYKTKLQEYVQAKGGKITYKDKETVDIPPKFNSTCYIDGKKCGSGTAKTKKSAQQAAAQAALSRLTKNAGNVNG